MRLARAYDEGDEPLQRLATAVGKYYVCKRCPGLAFEALECLGGNGYVEESGMPRLYREAPLNSIWEGSGNVNALDVLRALAKQPEVLQALLRRGRARPPAPTRAWTRAIGALRDELADLEARRVARAPHRRAHGARAAGLAARAPRAGRGRRRVLRGAAGRRRRAGLRDAARAASTRARSSSATPRRA